MASFLLLAGAIDLIAAISDVVELSLLGRIAAGEPVSLAEATASDSRQSLIGLVQLLLFLTTGILFIVWLYRGYANLPALGAEQRRFGQWWTIGAWFIPIWGQFRPKQLINDVWRGSDPEAPRWSEVGWSDRPVPGWWIVWWLVLLFSSWAGWIGLRVSFGAQNVEAIRLGSLFTLASDAAGPIAAPMAAAIVRAISLRQVAKGRSLGMERSPSGAGGPPAVMSEASGPR